MTCSLDLSVPASCKLARQVFKNLRLFYRVATFEMRCCRRLMEIRFNREIIIFNCNTEHNLDRMSAAWSVAIMRDLCNNN